MNDEDFYRDLAVDVDDAHAAWDEANDAPPALWQRIRAQYSSEKEDTTVSVNPALSSPVFTRTHTEVGTMQRFSGMVATLAIVGVLAFGGWFAAMNLPPAVDPDPRFAALGLQTETAGNGVCDVEPISVDEAIAILKDPLRTLVSELDDPVASGYSEDLFNRQQITLPNDYYKMANLQKLDAFSMEMPQTEFAEALPVVNEYLDCLHAGTVGQELRLMDPIAVQFRLVSALPTLTSEEEARVLLPEILAGPATFVPTGESQRNTGPVARLNPKVGQSRLFVSTEHVGFSGYAMSPVQYLDGSETVTMEADLRGRMISDPDQMAPFSMNVIYGQSSLDLNWYVIDIVFPFNLPG